MGYGIGNVLQLVTVFPGQLLHSLLHCDRAFVRGFGGKKDTIGRAGDESHKANDNNDCGSRAHARYDCHRQRVQRRQEMPNCRAHGLNCLACLLGSVLGSLPCPLGHLLGFLLGDLLCLHGAGGGSNLLSVAAHAADFMRSSFYIVRFFFDGQPIRFYVAVRCLFCRITYARMIRAWIFFARRYATLPWLCKVAAYLAAVRCL